MLAFGLAVLLLVAVFSGCAAFATADDYDNSQAGGSLANGDTVTINVYNWGQYIAEGDEGSIDVVSLFEKKYPNIKVNYTTYDTNESLYTKLKTGGISVDVIIPSDYMIARMIEEDMLLELNYDNIPNYQYVDEAYKYTDYDPDNRYSVPYTWGTVGIIYNTKYVEKPTGWDVLWDSRYKDKILMFGNSRDAFGIAEYLLGYDVNTTREDELQACAEKLIEQKPLVQQYIMDEVFDIMENEEAWVAPYYAGDYLIMSEENPDLAFCLPETQSFNFFIDGICIPNCCQNKEAAELFINFLCDPEIAGGNMDWIGYGTPISAAKEYLAPEVAESEVAYPDPKILARGTSFLNIPAETNQYIEDLWLKVKIS